MHVSLQILAETSEKGRFGPPPMHNPAAIMQDIQTAAA